jgi:hypothetical protein
MKKLYFLAFFVLAFTTNAQIVSIPNVTFKAKLLSASASNYIAKANGNAYVSIDTNGDGEIQVSEAQSIKYLNVSSSSI